MKRIFVMAILVLLTATLASAQVGRRNTPQSDDRVREALTSAGVDFKIDGDGDFKMELDMKGGNRTQLVWARSKTMEYDMFEVREVFGLSYKAAKPPAEAVLLDLLLQNGSRKIGGWQLEKWSDDYVLIFSVRVSADADGDQLKSIVELVQLETDAMEKKLTDGKDEF